MTPPARDLKGRCSVCGRVDDHKPWCQRIAELLEQDTTTFCARTGCHRLVPGRGLLCVLHDVYEEAACS